MVRCLEDLIDTCFKSGLQTGSLTGWFICDLLNRNWENWGSEVSTAAEWPTPSLMMVHQNGRVMTLEDLSSPWQWEWSCPISTDYKVRWSVPISTDYKVRVVTPISTDYKVSWSVPSVQTTRWGGQLPSLQTTRWGGHSHQYRLQGEVVTPISTDYKVRWSVPSVQTVSCVGACVCGNRPLTARDWRRCCCWILWRSCRLKVHDTHY